MISRTVELCVLKEWWAHEWMEGCSEGVTPSLPISLSRSIRIRFLQSPDLSRADDAASCRRRKCCWCWHLR